MNQKRITKLIRVHIHTLDIITPYYDETLLNTQNNAIKGITRTKDGFIIALNPNKLNIDNSPIKSITGLKTIMFNFTYQNNISNWCWQRIDLAIDVKENYLKLEKINRFILCLFALSINKLSDAIAIDKLIDRKNKALTCKKGGKELYIYDKDLESKGKHPFTRLEFRYTKLSQLADNRDTVLKLVITETITILNTLDNYITELNSRMIDCLYNLWKHEYQQGSIKCISEFYRKYNQNIFTREIARGLYIKIKPNASTTSFNDWIRGFRRKTPINFISNRYLKKYIKSIISSINLYNNEA